MISIQTRSNYFLEQLCIFKKHTLVHGSSTVEQWEHHLENNARNQKLVLI